MKKVVNILINLLFLISVTGVSIHKHYSRGRLYSTAFFHEAEKCCANNTHCDLATAKTSCHCHRKDACSCKNTVEFHRISDVFLPVKYALVRDIQMERELFQAFSPCDVPGIFGCSVSCDDAGPPPPNQREFTVFICVFLC